MLLNDKIKAELQAAIDAHTAALGGSFECTTSGGLSHFLSSSSEKRGLYICAIKSTIDGVEFKIYII